MIWFVLIGIVRIWYVNIYRLESTLNYGLERVWVIVVQKGFNNVVLGYDEGSIIIKVIYCNFCFERSIFVVEYDIEFRKCQNILRVVYYVCIVQFGREELVMFMDSSGKIIWVKYSEIQQVNIKVIGDQDMKDGERFFLAVKDMGSCEIYFQIVVYNFNGRLVCSCGLLDIYIRCSVQYQFWIKL